MKRIAAMALSLGVAATPALAAGPSSAPEKLSDAQLEQVAAGDLLGLDLGGILNGLGQPFGQGIPSNLGLAAGPVTAALSLQSTTAGLIPLIESVANLTGQMIQQAHTFSTAH